jgi:hypothetical protein
MLSIRLAATILAAAPSLFSADAALLNLIPPDAKIVGGMNVARAVSSPLGQHLLSRMNPDDPNFREFVDATGFDPRRDLREVVFASATEAQIGKDHGVMVARGVFNGPQIAAVAQAKGGTSSTYRGVNIVQSRGGAMAVAEGSLLVMGDETLVKSALDRMATSSLPQQEVVQRAQAMMNKYDVWLIATAPVRQFTGAKSNTSGTGDMKSTAMQAISALSGGATLDSVVQIEGEAVTRSEKDAQALIDVVRFLSGFATLNRENNAQAQQLQGILNSVEMRPVGNTVQFSAQVPESDLEQLLKARKTPPRAATRP